MTLGLQLVNYVLIYPIQSVLPLCAAFTAWRLLGPRGPHGVKAAASSAAIASATQKTPFLSWFAARSGRQIVRLYVQIELFTALYYLIRRQMLQRKPLVPQRNQSSEERRALLTRCHLSIDQMDFSDEEDNDDENGDEGDGEGADNSNSLSKTLSTTSVEQLLRDWSEDVAVVKNKSDDDEKKLSVPPRRRSSPRRLALKRAAVSGWFLGASVPSIRRGNLEQWVSWAFFLKRRHNLSKDESVEVLELVDQVVEWAQLTNVRDGFDESVRCIRLDFDPIPSSYRPFIYYLVTYGFVGIATEIIMGRFFGFEKHTSGCLTYWYRPPGGDEESEPVGGTTDEPLVLCHGLGIGVLSYVTLVNDLLSNPKQSRSSMFMVELPHISMRPVETQASPRELCTCIEDLLTAHGKTTAHFVGHSFGTLVLTWIARHTPHVVSRFTFLDPVCFLLCKHDVAYNFLYKKPTNATEALMKYFVGQELFISYTLSRRFFWQSNILWPEQIVGIPSTVVLSSEDYIVPSHAVRRFLVSWERRRMKGCSDGHKGGGGLKVVWLDGCGHAGFLSTPAAQMRVVEAIVTKLK